MLIDETIAIIERTVRHLVTNDPDYEKAPAILASPQWFVDDVKNLFRDQMVEPTDQLDQIAGLKVVIKADISEPAVISGKGATYPVLPPWARGANVMQQRKAAE